MDIDNIVAAESPREVVLFLTRNRSISYPSLDRLYSRNNWINVENNLELLKLVEAMKLDGSIEHSGGGLRKGTNWKEPSFLTENKYPID